VAVSNLFAAAIDAVVTFVPDALNGYSDFKIGGFSDVTMAKIVPAGGGILISLMLILTLSQQMDVLALGPETAQSLGLSVRPIRLLLLVLAAALCGAAISFSGLLGFVGLIVPHMMRRLVGEESLKLTFSCAMGGATLVALCDTLARIIFAPYELPVGIVLSFAGVPFFLWLLLRQRGGRISD
jgi:iron complex transport system permease protein